ncbi:MAG: helix-turn-helix domain-containing protein [Ruminococcaceae bacterium]|nr:helix-turn-helix domain-containing protein [Oscillospiraceae bacterium]
MKERVQMVIKKKQFLEESFHTFRWSQSFRSYRSYPNVQLIRVLSGEADWMINQKLYHVQSGDILLLSAVDYRQFMPLPEGMVVEMSALRIRPPRSHAEDMTVFYLRHTGFSNLLPRDNPHTAAIAKLHEELITCIRHPEDPLDTDFMEAVLSLICVHLKYIYHPGKSSGSRQDQLLREAYHYIADHFHEDLSTADIAKALYCTPEHLSRTFHRLSGIKLSDYIRRLRISRVLKILETGNMTVLEAAFSSGFASASGFYKAFRAEIGLSPREYFRKEPPHTS